MPEERNAAQVELRRGVGAAIQKLEQLPIPVHAGLTLLLLAAITEGDMYTSELLNLSIFYLIPTVWATWFVGQRTGLGVAAVSAITWSVVERGNILPFPVEVTAFNVLARVGFFVSASLVLTELRELSETRRRMAFSDALTGVANARVLQADLDREIDRLRRYGHPFAFAYVDLDHFKSVNDTLGHKAGDNVLRLVADTLTETVREPDLVVRVGGDEFAVLMPETNEFSARVAMERVVDELSARLREAAPTVEGLGVTVGTMVFTRAPWSTDQVLSLADGLLYKGKNEGRGVVRLGVYDGE